MGKPTDVRPTSAALYLLPVHTRIPLKFGTEVLTHVTCARARVQVTDSHGKTAEGWGETPLSVQWVWPSNVSYEERFSALRDFCVQLAQLWPAIRTSGHPLEIGHDFQQTVLPGLLQGFNSRARRGKEPMPWLAALLCCAPFDLATHDAFGQLHDHPIYQTYSAQFLNRDLSAYLQPAPETNVSFKGRYPADFLLPSPRPRLIAWHLVGGLDFLQQSDSPAEQLQDGFPVFLDHWIRHDGLKCLKIKLRGNDPAWDFDRLVRVGSIASASHVDWLSADFNCTVHDPVYVNDILDRLRDTHPRIYGMLLYVEQPFPYELEQHHLDVRSLSARKPLFLDESAHDWRSVQLGRHLGWSGVALKTCKTQTGAILSACWAQAHGMSLMVQDLTNPMLAQIPHVLLAAHLNTIMGVETNSMQFYPRASDPEAAVHPGLYRRHNGHLDLSTLRGPGFGYRLAEIQRSLPTPLVGPPS